jgi:hypothetical protein
MFQEVDLLILEKNRRKKTNKQSKPKFEKKNKPKLN